MSWPERVFTFGGRRFKALLESANVGIIVTAPDGAVRICNPCALDLLGISQQEFVNAGSLHPKWRFIDEDGSPCPPEDQPIQCAISTRQPVRDAVIGVYRPGALDPIWLLANALPQFDSRGALVEIVCTLIDISSRKQAEQAVRESEERFRQITESLQEALGLSERDMSKVLYLSPAFEEIWGRSRESVYQQPLSWIEAYHPDDRPRVEALLRKLLKGERISWEARVVRPDGSVCWVSQIASPILDAQGLVYRTSGSARDITGQKRAELALRESEARLRLLIGQFPCLLWTVDAGLRVTSSRGAGYKASDVRDDALAGRDLFDVFHTSDPDFEPIAAHRRALDGEPADFELRWTGRKWSGRVFQAHVEPLRDEEGRITGAIGVALDVTERKQAESDALAWKNRYEAAIQASGQLLYDWDPHTDRVTWGGNPRGILGYSIDELAGGLARWIELVHPDDRAAFQQEAERVRRTYEPFHLQYRVKTKDGAYIDVQDDGYAVLDGTGAIVRMVGFIKDVSERRRLEDQLRQSQKMEAVGNLAGGVAHDFNNLLMVILGYTQLLRDQFGPGSGDQENIDEIEKAAHRAAQLTNRLLAFSRRQLLKSVVVDLNEVVTDSERMLTRLIGENIEFRTVLRPGLWAVRVDRGGIEQVIMNLAVNARDAMPAGGRLTIETANVDLDEAAKSHEGTAPGPYVMLAVSDTGTGMDPETRARIFEPFFTTKGRGSGTGLGLSMVYGIIRQSEGYVSVASEPGEGATFKIYLPRVDAPVEARPSAAAPAEVPGGRETILLVEDEEGLRRLLRDSLERTGYAVLEAANGVEALSLCAQAGPIDLIVTDVVMPEMGGPALVANAAKLRPGVKALFMSGYADDALVNQGGLDPATPFLPKPFSGTTLARKVRELLDSRG